MKVHHIYYSNTTYFLNKNCIYDINLFLKYDYKYYYYYYYYNNNNNKIININIIILLLNITVMCLIELCIILYYNM